MYKATITLAAFAVFLGCNADSPTSPGAAKHTEAEAEQCPMPILGIAGTWAMQASYYFSTVDTLRIEFASDPNPTGEPGVTYYDYTLLSHYSPSDRDDPRLADLLAQPLWCEERGKMGVYYADGGTWAFNQTVTYIRIWNAETKEYAEAEGPFAPLWGLEIRMFDGWLLLGRDDYAFENIVGLGRLVRYQGWLLWNDDLNYFLNDFLSYSGRYKRVDE